ncbi:MAG: HAMP domain-containing histidine kinase [Clostridia bacterium]|nr:HAMP domain-containing histidine kinase [Clostridia bacterium]
MFKTTFSKYIVAFVLIILVSFMMLSSIITSMVQTYANDEKEHKLVSTSRAISAHIINGESVDIENYKEELLRAVTAIVNLDNNIHVIIADDKGKIFLTTYTDKDDDAVRRPVISDGSQSVQIEKFFFEKTSEGGEKYLAYTGTLDGFFEEKNIACAQKVYINNQLRGYVIALTSTSQQDNLISTTRRAVVNSSVWVMLAAVIAVYFITERIIQPLRNMTAASKKFAKGDFETRVTVYGEDEVSELARSFNHMADSLANLEKMRNSFLANVSHDLRTPMTTISGFIDGITSGAIPEEKRDYYLGVISDEVHRLSRLVSQLLDVSRLESGDRKFNFEDFDVAEMARIILISFEQKIDAKRLDVEFDSESDQMPVYADKDAIHQVVYNLCHNAIKFSNDGGKFSIKITRSENKKITVSIFDDGQAIPEEDLPMIFERFYKIDKSRGLDRSGVGLGLYICKTIIDAHGESISVESKEGVGTSFSFTLAEGEAQKRK